MLPGSLSMPCSINSLTLWARCFNFFGGGGIDRLSIVLLTFVIVTL